MVPEGVRHRRRLRAAGPLPQDDRVVWERTNIRHVQPHQLPELAEIAVIDLAFISLTKVFGVTVNLLVPNGEVVALISLSLRPGRIKWEEGIVRDPRYMRGAASSGEFCR